MTVLGPTKVGTVERAVLGRNEKICPRLPLLACLGCPFKVEYGPEADT